MVLPLFAKGNMSQTPTSGKIRPITFSEELKLPGLRQVKRIPSIFFKTKHIIEVCTFPISFIWDIPEIP